MNFLIVAGVILLAVGIIGIVAHELDKRAQEKEKENQRRIREESALRIERQQREQDRINRANAARARAETPEVSLKDVPALVKKNMDREIEEAEKRIARQAVRRSSSSVGGYTPTPYPATTYTGGYYDSGSSYGGSSSSSSSSSCSSSSSSSYSSSDSGGGGFSGGCD